MQWTNEYTKLVQELKSILISKPVLTIFDPKFKSVVYTDASRDGLGRILTQKTNQGEKAVAYFSVQTSDSKKKKVPFL